MSDQDVLEEARRLLADWKATGPHAGRLECGPVAYEVLLMRGDSYPEAVGTANGYRLWGVPIVERFSMEPPTRFELLSTEGELMRAGDVAGART